MKLRGGELYKYHEKITGGQKIMWSKDVFNTARNIFMLFGSFFNEVSKEISHNRTLEIFIKSDHERRITRINQLLEIDELDLNDFAKQIEMFWYNMGFDVKVEATQTSIITTTKKCPLYDGLLAAGVDHSTIEAFCRGKDEAGDALYKQLYRPYAGVKMHKFRSGPDDICIEEVIYKAS
jgi:hypothetical protein